MNLTDKQIDFLCDMMETDDVNEAIEKFAALLAQEKVLSSQMPLYIDKLMDRISIIKKK